MVSEKLTGWWSWWFEISFVGRLQQNYIKRLWCVSRVCRSRIEVGHNITVYRWFTIENVMCQFDVLVFKCQHPGFIRSTPPNRPNTVVLKCPSVRPQKVPSISMKFGMYVRMRAFVTRSSYSLSSYECAPIGVSRGRLVMHDGMQYDPIQGQGHEPLKIRNSAIFKGHFLPQL